MNKRHFNPELQYKVGKIMRKKRLELCLDQLDLADMLDVSNQAICMWESGATGMSVSSFYKVMKGLKLSWEDFKEVFK